MVEGEVIVGILCILKSVVLEYEWILDGDVAGGTI